MKITLLGTGTSQGVPVIGCNCEVCSSKNKKDSRLRSSALVEWDHLSYVIDCGTDFRTQMLREKIDKINGILFTHEHADHTAGLDDIRPLYFTDYQPIKLYGLERVINDLSKRFQYIFTKENKYPGAPDVEPFHIQPFQSFQLGNKKIIPIPITHGNLPILAYRIDNFAYITDAKTISEKSITKLQNLEVLVINALHHQPHKMHMNLEESLAMIRKINPQKAILTHVSHHMGLYEKVQAVLPKNVVLGFDGMKFTI
jgi:phosphoribosyl 1,2-cyclic phosphate phosphodiesterase